MPGVQVCSVARSDRGPLQEQHKVSRKQADIVGEQIRSWTGLLQYPGCNEATY
jgi:hypothetical protein